MKAALVGFVLRRVRHSLWQLRWTHLLTCGTLALTLFVFGAFILLQVNLQRWLERWGAQLQITAYLKNDLSADAVVKLVARVNSLPEVERVQHIDQERAWRDFKAALGAQSGLTEGLPAEILPASIEITLRPEGRDGAAVERLSQRLRGEPEIAVVEYPQEWVERLAAILLAISWGKWIVGSVLFLATFFIVGSCARLALLARKDEIEIMQLVGASEGLVQAPFVIEGTVIGLFGAAAALAALTGGFVVLQGELAGALGNLLPSDQIHFLDAQGVGLMAAIGWLLGAGGSLFSLRRFIRRWKPAPAAR